MVATIQLTAASSDLKGYLNAWDAANPVVPYGTFNPGGDLYNQWVGGGATPSTYGVILDGNFDGYASGNLTGVATGLTFGTGLAYDSGEDVYELSNEQLTIDLNNANVDPFDTFDYAVYGLINSNVSYLYTYFDAVGTEQVGTSGGDRLYSFAASDSLTGGHGNDTFVFAGNWGSDTVTDFGDTGGNTDILDFTGVTGIVDVTDLVFSYSNWYDSSNVLTISYGGNTLVVEGYVGSDILDFQANNQLLA